MRGYNHVARRDRKSLRGASLGVAIGGSLPSLALGDFLAFVRTPAGLPTDTAAEAAQYNTQLAAGEGAALGRDVCRRACPNPNPLP